MLTCHHITVVRNNRTLLKDVNFQLDAGKLHLIIGPNGAGKSTLLRVISGQMASSSGTVSYGGKSISAFNPRELAKVRALLSQHQELSFPLKVREVVMMGRYPHIQGRPSEKDMRYGQEAMQLFDLVPLSDRDYTSLSGGEKQRVHFARILSQIWEPVPGSCRYLLLDEPLTFLDVHYQFRFMRLLKELLQQQDLVITGVVHDLHIATRFADHLLLLHGGELVSRGSRETVLSADNIQRFYQLEEEDASTIIGKAFR